MLFFTGYKRLGDHNRKFIQLQDHSLSKANIMETMTQTNKVLYTAKTITIGGREHGESRSSDGHLDIKLSPPGADGTGTNPEQLFAAGWSACFEGAMGIGARKMRVSLPADTSVAAEVDLMFGQSSGLSLQARLHVTIPGVDRAIAQKLIDFAHENCPYSKATRGNIDVMIRLV